MIEGTPIPASVLLLHVSGDAQDIARAQGVVALMREFSPGRETRIIVTGTAIDAMVLEAAEPASIETGTQMVVCSTGLRSRGHDESSLLPNAQSVPFAAAYIAEQQWAGAAYLRM